MRKAWIPLFLLLLATVVVGEETPDPALEAARATLTDYAGSVNARNFEALGASFTKDVDYRSESWIHVQGIEAMVGALKEACAAKPELRLEIEPGLTRSVSPQVVQVDGRYTLRDAPDARPYTGGLTVTCVMVDGHWKIATLRDWPDLRTPRQELFEDLAWLVGSWLGEAADVPFRIDAALTPGDGFLHLAMELGEEESSPIGMSTLFGLDANTRTVRSWHFLHDGGFGEGTWALGKNVLEGKVRFVIADGTVVESVRRLALREDGLLVIETKERRVGEEKLPPVETLVLKPVVEESTPAGS